jgi:hypothetical protein
MTTTVYEVPDSKGVHLPPWPPDGRRVVYEYWIPKDKKGTFYCSMRLIDKDKGEDDR